MQSFKEYLLANQDKKESIQITTSMPQYPTGYMYLDYGTGAYLTVYNEREEPLYQYRNIGITHGSVNTVIAKSQGGKTTLCLGIGAAIIEPYITEFLYFNSIRSVLPLLGKKDPKPEIPCKPYIQILDTEKTLPVDYAKKVARYTNKQAHAHIDICQITTDVDVIMHLELHVKYKVENMKKVPMPMLDMFGKPIWDYPPTIMIIDSGSQLLLEDCDDPNDAKKGERIIDIYTNSSGNASGARRAKIITALYSQLVNYAKKYNIIIFSINHINKLLPMNGMLLKQYRGLKQGETIGGGERAIYLSANILRLDVIKSIGRNTSTSLKLGDGVEGFVAKASWIKSKSNSRSNECMMIYTGEAGYDPFLSDMYQAMEVGHVTKAGNSFYIPGYEKLKFTLKNCKEVFADHPELIGSFYDLLTKRCAPMLDNPDNAAKANRKLENAIRNEIHEEYSGSDAMDMDDLFAGMINN